jgi:hypothetical protein
VGKQDSSTVNNAIAGLKRSTRTDVLKVATTRAVTQGMQQNADWSTATDIQGVAGRWADCAEALDANAQVIAGLEAQLRAAVLKQCTLRRTWQATKVQVLSTVTVFCAGSADRVKAWCLDVLTRERHGLLDAPADLTLNPGTAFGDAEARWAKGPAGHGFLAQYATDPGSPATISAAIACTRPSLALKGMTPGAALSVRVAAIDPASPTGQTGWTAWVLGNAR